MLIPVYWVESRLRERRDGRQVTVRRWGWSDVSEDDARAHGERRARAALERIFSGERLARRERRVGYNGGDGIPIREEIIARHGDAIITRNSYGALCLNTPDVPFVDVDVIEPHLQAAEPLQTGPVLPPSRLSTVVVTGLMMWGVAHLLGFPAPVSIAAALIGFILGSLLHRYLLHFHTVQAARMKRQKARSAVYWTDKSEARNAINRFASHHPDLRFDLYETPAGFRLLFLNATWAPGDPALQALFSELRSDPLYARMCVNQACYRARISPKPWRIDMEPMPFGAARRVWPFSTLDKARRSEWLRRYDQLAQSFAACELVGRHWGGTAPDSAPNRPEAEQVRELHDRYCRIGDNLPTA